MRIIAYAYEAAIHCPRCHDIRALHALPGLFDRDREGNEVVPIYDCSNDVQEGDCCDTCGDCLE